MESVKIDIRKITSLDSSYIEKVNELFDQGTTWDTKQGEKFLADTNNALFLAFTENQPVGFLTAHRLQRFDARKAEVILYEIGVHESFRKKGIAKALIDHLKTWAKQVEADEIWVLTERSNAPAVALYTSCGGKEESKGDEVMYVFKLDRAR